MVGMLHASYGTGAQVVILVPFLLAGPRLFDLEKPITMGLLVQVADAFGTTFSSLSIGMTGWASVNDFRSVVRRLRDWEAHLEEYQQPSVKLTGYPKYVHCVNLM